ncbi:MAG: glycosyltransferase [Gemmatimonadota bacterium]
MAIAVSVVIPLFNREALVEEAVRSALAQLHPPAEIIVVDDGSTDRSAEVAARLPVTLLRLKHNEGLSSARNAGIRSAKGDVIAFLDSDDRWLPGHLSTIVDLLASHPDAGIAYTRMRSFGAASAEWRLTVPPETVRDCYWDLVESMIIPIPASAVRRRLITERGAFDPSFRIAEDYEFFLRHARFSSIVCSNDITVEYRVHDAQLSSNARNIILGTWRARLVERNRLIHYGEPAELQRFDRIAQTALSVHNWTLVHNGDSLGLKMLHDQIRTETGGAITSALLQGYRTLAVARNWSRHLPTPLRNVGRRLATMLPH